MKLKARWSVITHYEAEIEVEQEPVGQRVIKMIREFVEQHPDQVAVTSERMGSAWYERPDQPPADQYPQHDVPQGRNH